MSQENQSSKKQSLKSKPLTLSLLSSTIRKSYHNSEHPSKRWGHSAIIYNNSMIIFGGRHLQRSLSNIYSLDFSSLTWSKMEPIGSIPLGRDSHTAVLYNNSHMIIFGGNGLTSKFNDLWDFDITEYKWTKITTQGNTPCARDGHLSALIYNKYMIIYAGLNEKDEVINDIFLFDFEKKEWKECELINGNFFYLTLKKKNGKNVN